MTPKEKASELINKFIPNEFSNLLQAEIRAKKCALICVDFSLERICELNKLNAVIINEIEYLKEVKKEIENL